MTEVHRNQVHGLVGVESLSLEVLNTESVERGLNESRILASGQM